MSDVPLVSAIAHHFVGGVYFRVMEMPAGYEALTHSHKYEHASICAKGSGVVEYDEGVFPFKAGDLIKIAAHKAHYIIAHEDTIWMCCHREDADEVEDFDAVMLSKVEL